MTDWLLLHYNLSAKHSTHRVYIWRKLKRLGAVLLQDAIWILPDTPRTEEQFQWLTTEIREMNGDVFLWRSKLVLGVQENVVEQQFSDQVNGEYSKLIKKMKRKNVDLREISRQYQQIFLKDYFHSKVGQQLREKLISLRQDTK